MGILENGTGGGRFAAKVDEPGRLHTFSTNITAQESAAKKGAAFNVSSPLITLTDDAENAILYFKSNEESLIEITEIIVQTGESKNLAGDILTADVIRKDYIGPTTGTLITDQNPGFAINRNAAAVDQADVTIYVPSGVGKTLGGAIAMDQSINRPADWRSQVSGFILPKGSSLGVSFQAPAGNVSMNVIFFFSFHLLDAE
jgi:hypothetical protein